MASKPKPRALIREGTSYVGSHPCERFLSEGYRVVCNCPDIIRAKESLGWEPHTRWARVRLI